MQCHRWHFRKTSSGSNPQVFGSVNLPSSTTPKRSVNSLLWLWLGCVDHITYGDENKSNQFVWPQGRQFYSS